MDLSMRWLKDYVNIEVDPHTFASEMTMSGSKVEDFAQEGAELSNIVVGKILSVEKHPDADKLQVCQLDVGQEQPIQIVTAAQNVAAGQLVPVALDRSVVHGGQKITRGKLRGVASEGMLCSVAELGVTVHDFPYAIEDGIFIIEEDCTPGQDIHTAIGLDDITVEFEITSNRPDCLSVLGLAREAAATFHTPLLTHYPVVKGAAGDVSDYIKVSVEDPDLCSRYMAKVVKNVKIGPSPRWLRERLRACNVRPINNIVDITNFVMLEYGHPMHAFDLRYVGGNQINVRRAKDGETITTLDGAERALNPSMLVIADQEKPMAVAGVMGGEYSGIMEDTTTVVFESACFDGTSVRITSKALGMRTDSSARFEKGLHPACCEAALMRACELVEVLGCGEVVGGHVDARHFDDTPKSLMLDAAWTNRFLGTDIEKERMVEILKSLDFTVEGDTVYIPPFRIDIEHKADLAEEIARIYGYNNIQSTVPSSLTDGRYTPSQQLEKRIARALLGLGYSEILTYSFISPKLYDKIGLPADSPMRNSVTIQNPLGEDTSVMRTTAVPSMLEVLSRNFNNRNASAALFELATEYEKTGLDTLPNENKRILLGVYGPQNDFFTLKGAVEALLSALHVGEMEVEATSNLSAFHPGRCAELSANGTKLGYMGEIHPQVAENFSIGTKCYVASLDFGALLLCSNPEISFVPLPKFPAVTRDLALLCDDEIPVQTLKTTIQQAAGKTLEHIALFDVYKGDQIESGKKSVAFSLTLRSNDETLTDEHAERVINKVLRALEKIQVTIR